MPKQIFTIKPRELQKLFDKWGWEDHGPIPGHGTTRKRRWPGGRAVAVYAPGVKQHEHGNRMAIHEAAEVMGITVAEFLLGPPEQKKSVVDQTALDRAYERVARQAEEHQMMEVRDAANTERAHNNPKWPGNKGLTRAIAEFFVKNEGRWVTAAEVDRFISATTDIERGENAVSGILSHKSRNKVNVDTLSHLVVKKNPNGAGNLYKLDPDKFERVKREREAARRAERERIKAEKAAARQAESEAAERHELAKFSVEKTKLPLNGSAPQILERIADLSGNSYLFRGDDEKLYVGSLERVNM